jgi:hypothetical protein
MTPNREFSSSIGRLDGGALLAAAFDEEEDGGMGFLACKE